METGRFALSFKRMNIFKVIACLITGLFVSELSAHAQKYQFTFRGIGWTTNAAGRFVSYPISERTWLVEYARLNGIRNLRSLNLIYQAGGDQRGDVIKIVNPTNGATIYPLFSFFFGESFDRAALTNRDGSQIKRLEYVYTHDNSHSVGSVLVTESLTLDHMGHTNRTLVGAQMDYFALPNALHPSVQICNGTLTLGRLAKFAVTNSP
jgi:hypothetical protein